MNPTNPWPEGRTCAVVLSVNFDAESVDLHEARPESLFGRYSYGRYGMRAGIWRMLEVLRGEGVKATFFVPVLDAENHGRALEAVMADGHEIGARGLRYEDHSQLGERERETLGKAHDALSRITGSAPTGWRAPFGLLGPRTLEHLIDLGYRYDSSFQDDDLPYVMADSRGRALVELPTSQALTDATYYEPRHSHVRVLKTWREEFDAIYAERGFVNLTLHPRGDYGSGRLARAQAVGEFIRYMARHPGVFFCTARELAETWALRNPAGEPLPAFPPPGPVPRG